MTEPSASRDQTSGSALNASGIAAHIPEQQLQLLETVYGQGQFSEGDGFIQFRDRLQDSGFNFFGVQLSTVQDWFVRRRAEAQPAALQAAQGPQGARSVQQQQAASIRLHVAKDFWKKKAALFKHIYKFYNEHPGANVILGVTSPGSGMLWMDTRGPLGNAMSVLEPIATHCAKVLDEANEKSSRGNLDWVAQPGERYRRKTQHRGGGGYMLFQRDFRSTAAMELRNSSVAMEKHAVERRCGEAWRDLQEAEQEFWHRQARQQAEAQPGEDCPEQGRYCTMCTQARAVTMSTTATIASTREGYMCCGFSAFAAQATCCFRI